MESGPWGMCFDGRLDLCVPFLQVFAPGTKLCAEMSGDFLDSEKEPGAENLVVEYVGAQNMVVVYVDTLSTCLLGVVDRHGEECWQGAAAKCPESGVEMHGSGAQCEDTAMSGASPATPDPFTNYVVCQVRPRFQNGCVRRSSLATT